MKKTKYKILFIIFLIPLISSCGSEPDIGSAEWCEAIKDRKEADLTIREKGHMANCLLQKTADELSMEQKIIGTWERQDLEKIKHRFKEGFVKKRMIIAYYKNGKGQITNYYEEPTRSEENPKIIDFQYRLNQDQNEITYIFDGHIEENYKILELTEKTLVEEFFMINDEGTREKTDLPLGVHIKIE